MQTIKELASEIGISKVAVAKKIDSLGLRGSLIRDGNMYLIPDEICDQVRQSYAHKQSGSKPGRTASKDEPSKDVVQVLAEQLAEKDKQIERLMLQVESLQNQQAELIKSVQQTQFLLADSMGVTESRGLNVDAEVEVDHQEPPKDDSDPGDQEPKKGIWNRLFR